MFLQPGDQLVANAIAENSWGGVGGVVAEAKFIRPSKLQELRAGVAEERPNELNFLIDRRRVAPLHARESFPAAAAQEPQKKQLDLVIGVMRQGNAWAARVTSHASKELVPQMPRRHLDGDTFFARKGADRPLLDETGQAQRGGGMAHEPLVGVTAASAQTVVEMSHCKPPARRLGQPGQNVQQNGRIQATGSGDDDALPWTEQVARAN